MPRASNTIAPTTATSAAASKPSPTSKSKPSTTTTISATKSKRTSTKSSPTSPSGSSAKKLSPYNMFMKAQLPIYKQQHPDTGHREAFAQVAAMWKTAKENPKSVAAAK